MKKIIALFLAAAVFVLAGCSDTNKDYSVLLPFVNGSTNDKIEVTLAFVNNDSRMITGTPGASTAEGYDVDSGKYIKVKIADKNICERYTAVVLEKHGELKQRYLTWQDTILAKSGMRPVDSIVDATNYLMLLTGQPLHAFDYDKFVAVGKTDSPKIIVRAAKNGEKITLEDVYKAIIGDGGEKVELDEDLRKKALKSINRMLELG